MNSFQTLANDKQFIFDLDMIMSEKSTYQESKQEVEKRNKTISSNEPIPGKTQRAAAVGCWEWDLKQETLLWSDEVFSLFGLDPNEFIPSPGALEATIHPDDLEVFLEQREKMLNENQKVCIEHRIVLPDGSVRYVQESTQLIINDQNGMCRVIGTVQEIKERRHAEASPRESEEKFRGIVRVSHHKKEEERYRQIIESSIDGFWIIDSKGTFLDVNQAYCLMIGYGRNEVLNMSIMDIEVDMSLGEIGGKIGKVIEEGYGRFETRHRHKNGGIIDVEVSTSYSRGSDEVFFVFLRDITERKLSEEKNRKLEIQLQQSQKLQSIGTLAGGIAHDFNNILYPIIGFAEMSIQDLPENHPIKDNLEDILIGAKRARDLVKQILSFSRQKKSILEPLLLQPIIIESLKLLRSSIPSNIEIIKNFYTGTDYVFANSTEIHEIIMNLCTNAYHAMEDTGGTLKISLSKIESDSNLLLSSKEYCCLSISDTGIGIPSEVIKNIYDPYFTTKEQGKGSGLGLSVIHGIVKSYEGEVRVESEPGKGSTFSVFFPICANNEVEDLTLNGEKLLTGNERILLVDDEKAIVKLGLRLLERLGYKVTGKVSSVEALALFKSDSSQFDLIITDMTMPMMVGTEFAKKVMEIRSDIPILICTGFSEKIDDYTAKSLGIQGFIHKPILMNELASKVRELIDSSP